MTRLVLILDETNGRYRLVTGEGRAQIALKQTVERKNVGFSMVLDVNLPVTQSAQLDFGEVKGSIALMIDCSNPSLDRFIDHRQRQALQLFVTQGSTSFKNQIEKLMSKVKVRITGPGVTPFDQNRAVSLVYPFIMEKMRELVATAAQEPNLPFLSIHISDSLNQSAYVDKLLNQDMQARMEILRDISTPKFPSAYPPDEEYRMLREHAEQMMLQWPSSLAPRIHDASQLLPIIEEADTTLHGELFLEEPKPGFWTRLLGK